MHGADRKCAKRVRVAPNKPARVVTSPGYPKPYPADAHCTWRVTTKKKHRLQLTVSELDVEGTDRCLFDFVEVRRAGRKDANVLARYCGTLRQLHPAAVNLSTTGGYWQTDDDDDDYYFFFTLGIKDPEGFGKKLEENVSE